MTLGVLALSAAATAASSAAPSAGTPSDAVYRKLCRAIRPDHVRALFTGPAAPIRLGGDADCAFSPRGGDPEIAGVKVFLRIDDGDRTLWSHRGDRPYGTFHWLSKTGRLTKWGDQGGRLPSVVDARRGSFTCTTIPVGIAGLAIPAGSTLTAARTYARRLLALCDDVYAAHS
ncbi:MAG TPA: hypothetical protein VG652_04005 [Gaiellaceae bacterium]|nr:hypothetical protein [Gaiellaceae bacterium]